MTSSRSETDPALRALVPYVWDHGHGDCDLVICRTDALAAAEAAPLDVELDAATNRLFLAVRRVIRDGIDSDGTFLELHEAFYAVRALRLPDSETAGEAG